MLCTWFPPSPTINVSWRFSPHQHIWLESFISQAVSYHKLSPWSPVVSISHIWIHTLFSARWYLEPVPPQLWPSAMRGSEKPSTELFHSQTQGLAFPSLVFVHHLWWVVPQGGETHPVGWKLFSREGGAVRLCPVEEGWGGECQHLWSTPFTAWADLLFILFALCRLGHSRILGDMDWTVSP